MKAPRFCREEQREMADVMRCAEALQHWPLDRIDKAMGTAEADLLARWPAAKGVLEMIRLAQPPGMDVLAAAAVTEHKRQHFEPDYQPLSKATKRALRDFVTLAKLRALLVRRACPKARRREEELPPLLPPATQVEIKLRDLTVCRV